MISTTVEITGLTSNAIYSVTVKARDSALNVSGASDVFEVSTIIDGISTPLKGTIKIYPNPAKDVINVEVPEGSIVQITNLSGETVLNKVAQTGKESMPLHLC